MKRSKNYKAVANKQAHNDKLSVIDAIDSAKKSSLSKFIGSLEIQIILNIKEKQKKESIRGAYSLPHKFGKETKVLVFHDPANTGGIDLADIAGGEELIEDVMAGKLDFDVVIATPAMMPKIAKLGKVLGTKGMMPNPKNGTVTTDIANTINSFKSGKKNFKMTDSGIINAIIGKVDMSTENLAENLAELMKAVSVEIKKFGSNPVKSITIKPTMGLLFNIDINSIKL
jgi:large subunit ribosomal protein L1